MGVLTNSEKKQLVAIIEELAEVDTPQQRINFLDSCGLKDLDNIIPLGSATRDFAQTLVSKADDVGILKGSQQSALMCLLSHLAEIAAGQPEVLKIINDIKTRIETMPPPTPEKTVGDPEQPKTPPDLKTTIDYRLVAMGVLGLLIVVIFVVVYLSPGPPSDPVLVNQSNDAPTASLATFTPGATNTPVITVIRQDIEVAATDDDRESDVFVEEGDVVNITANGTVNLGKITLPIINVDLPYWQTDFTNIPPVGRSIKPPDWAFGVPTDFVTTTWNIEPAYPHGALLCKIDIEPTWSLCGATREFTATETGELLFGINDKEVGDNDGETFFRVFIRVTKQ